jgi:predicted DNA-binding protein
MQKMEIRTKGKKKAFGFVLPISLMQKLACIALAEDVSNSFLVRKAVENYLNEKNIKGATI